MDKQNQFNAQQQHQTDSRAPLNALEDKELSSPLAEGWHTYRENSFKDSVYASTLVEERFQLLLCLLGYGLLLFALVDYIHIVIPPRFTDPSWEFQTIGVLVEHAVVPLLGLIFVFYSHQGYIRERQTNLLRFLSWVSLLVGLVYLLMLPLGVADTWRIYYGINAQITAQVSQQSQQLQQLKGQLNQATTDEQLKQLVASLAPQGRSLEIKNPQASKDQFLTEISQAQQSINI